MGRVCLLRRRALPTAQRSVHARLSDIISCGHLLAATKQSADPDHLISRPCVFRANLQLYSPLHALPLLLLSYCRCHRQRLPYLLLRPLRELVGGVVRCCCWKNDGVPNAPAAAGAGCGCAVPNRPPGEANVAAAAGWECGMPKACAAAWEGRQAGIHQVAYTCFKVWW